MVYKFPELIPVSKQKSMKKKDSEAPAPAKTKGKAPARKTMAQETFKQLPSKPVNVSAPMSLEEMPKIGSPEPTRRLPGQRVIGKGTSGRGTKIIGALYDSQKLYQDPNQPHYRERASRVIKVEESPLITKIRHGTDKPDTGQRNVISNVPETVGRHSVAVQSINRGNREFGNLYADVSDMKRARPTTKREMAIQAVDESIEQSMIEEPDILKPTANELGVMKKPAIPQAPPMVANEPQIRYWKELKLGEHIPSADIHPTLSLIPGRSAEAFANAVSAQDVEIKEKKPRKPRKHKVMEGMTEMKEEEMSKAVEITPKGVVKTEVEKIEKKKRQPSAYNKFVAEMRRKGHSMAEIGEMYRKNK